MRTKIIALSAAACLATGCAATNGTVDTGALTIYEVNVRQHTPEGTFDAFRAHIPRLEEMGVGILWLMPIHPIGEEQRKGTLGSYYAASDYLAVNPEFGDEEDFRELVDAAHDAGMLVILDWVANHTAWDHLWTTSHPQRYTRGEDGGFTPPVEAWADVIDLDYDEPGTAPAMAEAMSHWVRTFGVDGFRCDVAEMVPAEFWEETIGELRAERPLFMLAEGGSTWLHDVGFDATYGWGLGDVLLRVARGESDAADVRALVEEDLARLAEAGPGAFRMHFTSNHDWNSWNGVAAERLGPAWEAATALTFTLPGMPLIYNGQEAGLEKQLAFFEKDEIDWRADHAADLYRRLALLKRDEPALRHGEDGGALEFLDVGAREQVIAFRRTHADSEVVVVANLSGRAADVRGLPLDPDATYADLHGFPADVPARLDPWGWVVLTRSGD